MLEAKSADCEQLRSMNKLKDSEIEELKNRISKLEGHCQEKDRTIANIQGELTTKSGECNELKNKNLAQDKIIDQNKKAIQSLE